MFLAVGERLVVSVDFTAGPGATSRRCRNTAWATAERLPYTHSRSDFENTAGLDALLRDTSLSVNPRGDLTAVADLREFGTGSGCGHAPFTIVP